MLMAAPSGGWCSDELRPRGVRRHRRRARRLRRLGGAAPTRPRPRPAGLMAAPSDTRPTRSRSRLRLGIVIALVCGAIAFLLVQGLGNATTYFRNADEALADRDDLGTSRFRLQGTVVDAPRSEGGAT